MPGAQHDDKDRSRSRSHGRHREERDRDRERRRSRSRSRDRRWGWVGAGIARQAGWQSWVQVRECRVANSGTEHALSVVCPAGETTGIATTGGGTTVIAMTGGGMIATATTGAAAAPPTMQPHTTTTGGATDWVYCASPKLWMLCSYNLACSQVSNAMQRQAQNRRPNPAHPQNDSDLLGSKHWLPASPRCFTAWVPFQSRC